MGEIADMMLEGVLCATCGTFLDAEGDGFPAYCSPACEPDGFRCEPMPRAAGPSKATLKKIAAGTFKKFLCPLCGKRFRTAGGSVDHHNAKHPDQPHPES